MIGTNNPGRWLLWGAGTALLFGLLTACSPSHAIAAVDATVELEDRYAADLPAADAAGRQVTLELEPSGRVALVMDYEDKGAIVQTGTWRAEETSTGETRLILSLTEQEGRQLDEMIVFELRGDKLVAVAYDTFVWGDQGLVLTPAPDNR